MRNYYIHEGFSVKQLQEKMTELQFEVKQLGELYNGKSKNFTGFQIAADHLDTMGYDYSEQIHDCYSEMGAVIQALKHHGVEV